MNGICLGVVTDPAGNALGLIYNPHFALPVGELTMDTTASFLSVSPIGDTDPLDMPVADVHQAVIYYQDKLGFHVETLEPGSATLTRDAVTLRLAQNGGDPEQASCYIGVRDVAAVHRELLDSGAGVSERVGDMEHDGKTYRVIWLRDPDGLCYCIGQANAP